MEEQRLIRKLNSVGKEKFVLYYYLFKDYANNKITKDSAIQTLVDEKVGNEAGASIRLGNAKIIFNEMGSCEALMIVQKSKALSDEIIKLSIRIIKEECE